MRITLIAALSVAASVLSPSHAIAQECETDLNTDGSIDFFDVIEFIDIVDRDQGPCLRSTLIDGPFDPIVASENFRILQTLLESGGTISLPSGVFHIQTPGSGDSLDILIDGTSLVGTGNTTLVFSREIRNGAFGGIRADGVSNISIRGIRFQGVRDRGDPDTAKWGRHPSFTGGTGLVIEDCEFSSFLPHNLYIGRDQAAAGTWIVDGDPNSQASVDALRALSAHDVVIQRCRFDSIAGSGIAIAGSEDISIRNNDFRFSSSPTARPLDHCGLIGSADNPGGGLAILFDDASQVTPLEFYSINAGVSVVGNSAPAGYFRLFGVSTAQVSNNRFVAIEIDSYDFNQQRLNFGERSSPFLWLDFVERDIRVAANFTDAICIQSKWAGIGQALANYRTQGTQVMNTVEIVEANCVQWPSNGIVYCDD